MEFIGKKKFQKIGLLDAHYHTPKWSFSETYLSKNNGKQNWATGIKKLLEQYNLVHLWYNHKAIFNLDNNKQKIYVITKDSGNNTSKK